MTRRDMATGFARLKERVRSDEERVGRFEDAVSTRRLCSAAANAQHRRVLQDIVSHTNYRPGAEPDLFTHWLAWLTLHPERVMPRRLAQKAYMALGVMAKGVPWQGITVTREYSAKPVPEVLRNLPKKPPGRLTP